MRRLNVSLDTLDPGRFRELTRRDGLEKVLAGLDAAKRAGFDPIKVNAVASAAFTEHDVVPLARYCREHGLELRFIEYMPIGADTWERDKVYFAHEILELLEREVGPLVPARTTTRGPGAWTSTTPTAAGGSASSPRCRGRSASSCNRIRLTADGKLRNCLFALDETDVKRLLRGRRPTTSASPRRSAASVWAKWEGHEINTASFVKPDRTMHAIGG